MFSTVLEAVGWIGSGLLVVSLLQRRMMRLRVVNLLACMVLVGYNLALGVWPMVGMNAAVAVIDVYFIVKLNHEVRAKRSLVQPGARL